MLAGGRSWASRGGSRCADRRLITFAGLANRPAKSRRSGARLCASSRTEQGARIESGCTLPDRVPIQRMSTEPRTSPAQSEQATAPTPDAIMQLGTGFWASKTLLSAVELGLFSELATAGALDGDDLRGRLGLHERSARDFFDALVALGMVGAENGLYGNTPATDFFLDRAKPSYIGGMLEMMNARLFGFWNSLTEGLRTGEAQNEIKTGDNFFEVLYADPARLRGFLKAMSGNSLGSA